LTDSVVALILRAWESRPDVHESSSAPVARGETHPNVMVALGLDIGGAICFSGHFFFT
jgi:hypothetical protein